MEWQVGKKAAKGLPHLSVGVGTDAGQTCFSTMLLREFYVASQNKGPGLTAARPPWHYNNPKGSGEIVIKYLETSSF